jgi:hypothetical protein
VFGLKPGFGELEPTGKRQMAVGDTRGLAARDLNLLCEWLNRGADDGNGYCLSTLPAI